MRYLPVYIYQIYLFKPIKDNRNRNIYETEWIK